MWVKSAASDRSEPVGWISFPEGLGSTAFRRPSLGRRPSTPSALRHQTSVVISIDAEIAPHTSDWQHDGGRFAADRDLYGVTARGERGLRYELDVIERHGLKAVVFLEALSAGVLGLDLLTEMVRLVRDRGHEVGLHIHTEWLAYYRRPLPGDRYGRNMSDFLEDDQVRLIDCGLKNLSRAGAGRTVALRAGNAGANTATLRAARRSGIAIDSSYFAPHLNGACRLPFDPELSQPARLEGIIEVPITWFRDGFDCIRPAQLCACSIGEFEHILQEAWSRSWRVVTLLLHSFELIRRRSPERRQTVVRLHAQRLVELCRWLARNRDKFVPRTFEEIETEDIATDVQPTCLRSSLSRTVRRQFEQGAGRVW
jgi:hypothetical protein